MSDFHEGYPTFEEWSFISDTERRPRSGLFGYEATMIDRAIRNDDPAAFLGFLREFGCDPVTEKTFDGLTMAQYCAKRRAKKCAAAIAKLS